MKNNTLIHDFTTGSIPKQLFFFATPLFLSSLLQVVYNMVDMIVVGHAMGSVGLSGVSVGGDVSNFLLFIAMGVSNAGQVIISQYIGADKREKLGRFITTMFSFLTICAVTLSVVCLIFRKEILVLMNTPEEAFEQALNYSTVCIVGMVFIYGYNMVSAVLRGMGDSKHPFVFISIAALLNIVLDLIFVIGFKMEALGAALATVISQGVSFISCCVFLYKKRGEFGFEFKVKWFFSLEKSMLVDLIKLGVPMAIKSASIHFSKMFVNSWINSYGVDVSAFAGIANKINSISNLVSNSVNTAGSSMVGQNIGGKKYDRVPKILGTIFAVTICISTVVSILIVSFPQEIFGIFTSDKGVLAVAEDYLSVAVLIFFGSAFRAPSNALINGSGIYKINFATAIFDGIIMRIGLSVLFGLVFNMEHIGFWLGDALAGYTPFFIGIIFFISGKWKKKEVK